MRPTEIETLIYYSRNNKNPPFEVTIMIDGKIVYINCNCPLGLEKKICRHKINAIRGDKKNKAESTSDSVIVRLRNLFGPRTTLRQHLEEKWRLLREYSGKHPANEKEIGKKRKILGEAFSSGFINEFIPYDRESSDIDAWIVGRINEAAQGSTNEPRSTDLIATFKNGFADGWTMLVPEAFREALDIKMTDRILDGKKEQVWTQGSRYNFRATDLIYSAKPEVYTAERWEEGVKSVNFAVEVLMASPASGGVNGIKRKPGFVRIKVFLPVGTKLIYSEVIDTNQDEFVRFLKTGFMCCHALLGIPENLHEYFIKVNRHRENDY